MAPRKAVQGLLPPPPRLGLPSHFQEWRRYQEEAILDVASLSTRVVGVVAPTGFGKSIMYMALARMTGGRTCVLTATKGLQEQLARDFTSLGLKVVMGQSNYLCAVDQDQGTTVDEGFCHTGRLCELKQGGCYYYDDVRQAGRSEIVVTNYAYWLHNPPQPNVTTHIGEFDLLVCDEAHELPDQVADFMTVTLVRDDLKWLDWDWKIAGRFPLVREWAKDAELVVKRELGNHLLYRSKIKHLRNLLNSLHRLRHLESLSWVEEHTEGGGIKWVPLWPGPYLEILLRGQKRVLMVSATLRDRTLDLLGVPQASRKILEYPSTFPAERRPIIWVKTVQLNARNESNPAYVGQWMDTIDNIIRRRQDRKGIIHTVSYKRAQTILSRSKFRHLMVTHDSRNTRQEVMKFKNDPRPTILVSPSLGTGWDFPYEQCEYQIIAKLPYPDLRSPVTKARADADKKYGPYQTMMALVQSVGRGMRAEDDRCETLVVDDNFDWFVRKHKQFAPKWFTQAVEKSMTVPNPPPKLEKP